MGLDAAGTHALVPSEPTARRVERAVGASILRPLNWAADSRPPVAWGDDACSFTPRAKNSAQIGPLCGVLHALRPCARAVVLMSDGVDAIMRRTCTARVRVSHVSANVRVGSVATSAIATQFLTRK